MRIRSILLLLAFALCVSSFGPAMADPWVEQLGVVVPPPWRVDGEAKVLDLVTDEEGNIYVTGFFRGSLELGGTTLESTRPIDHTADIVANLFVAKLDIAGNWLWASQASGEYVVVTEPDGPAPRRSDSEGRGVAIDGDGIYVTGKFTGRVWFDDIPLDVREQNAAYVCDDDARDSCVDTFRGADPTRCGQGVRCLPNLPDNAFIAKVDADGEWLWATQGGGGGTAFGNSIAVGPDPARGTDLQGNPLRSVYVVGETRAEDDARGQRFGPVTGVTCFNSCNDGPLFGETCNTDSNCRPVTTPPTGYDDKVRCLGLTSDDTCEEDIFLAKLRPDGFWLAATRYGGANKDSGNDVALDARGNVYFTGTSQDFIDYVVTYPSMCCTDWDCIPWTDICWCDTERPCDRTYVVQTERDCAQTRKLSLSGDPSWSNLICSDFWRSDAGGQLIGGQVEVDGVALTLDHIGNVYLAGSFKGLLLDPGLKTGTNVNFAHSNLANESNPDDCTTEFSCSYTNHDMFMARYTNDGTLRWTGSIDAPTDDLGRAIAIDDYGDFYLAAQSANQVLLTRWEPQGDTTWVKTISSGLEPADVTALEVNPGRELVLGGHFYEQVELGDGSETVALRTPGTSDAFVAQLDYLAGTWNQRYRLRVSLEQLETHTPHYLHEGDASPPVGDTWFVAGERVVASTPPVDDWPASDLADSFAMGWRGTGNVPAEGDGPVCEFIVDRHSELTWLYENTSALTIGRKIEPPDGAAQRLPDLEDISIPGDAGPFPFHLSEADGAIYAVRPVVADISWRRADDPEAAERITRRYAFAWPDDAQVHVAGTPVELNRAGDDPFLQILYTDTGEDDVFDTFAADRTGHTVFKFAHTGDGAAYDSTTHPSIVVVVETIEIDAASVRACSSVGAVRDGMACANDTDCPGAACVVRPFEQTAIGEPLEPGDLHDALGGSGFVFHFQEQDGIYPPYDAKTDEQPDGSYDRAERSGPIVPVNEVVPGIHDDLVVTWYGEGRVPGVYWGNTVVGYDPAWQTGDVIDIADGEGSEHWIDGTTKQEPLDPARYERKQIYDQPDRDAPGYNPNDEHALFAPSNTGETFDALFAIRADLGPDSYVVGQEAPPPIEPHVLLKYWDSDTERWAFRSYRVVTPDADGLPMDELTAGAPVRYPYPLGLLGRCAETNVDAVTFCEDSIDCEEPVGLHDERRHPAFWMDYKNTLWAVAATDPDNDPTGANGPLPDVPMTVRYWYPLQSGFFHDRLDLDDDPESTEQDGSCVPWLARLDAEYGNPIPVQYGVAWPQSVPELSVGETLARPKRGLPDIMSQGAAEVVFDQVYSLRADAEATDTLAKLFDPMTPRRVDLDMLPGVLATERNDLGEQVIVGNSDGTIKLPFHLRIRMAHNPVAGQLTFRGYLDETVAGEPLLLLNVMTRREADRLLGLLPAPAPAIQDPDPGACGCDPASDGDDCQISCFHKAVYDLYHLSRNPGEIDLDGDDPPVPDQQLLVGWTYDDGLEPYRTLGSPGALTAGAAAGTGYVSVAFNNDPTLSPLPVSVNVIRVGCPPYRGEIKVIESPNVFDEQLSLRHSGDFGAEPEKFWFEWYRSADPADPGGQDCPPCPGQQVCESCDIAQGWQLFREGEDLADIVIEADEQDPTVMLSDNYFMVRYRAFNGTNGAEPYAYPVCGTVTPTPTDPTGELWAGAPASTPEDTRAMLGEGWVKRVVRGFNPFEARVKAFHTTGANTFASMMIHLGERYEGDIAFSSDPDYLNSIGLIEAYETLLRRALILKGTDVNNPDVNNAILLAAGRIADFYMLLGNEAFGDAADPTIDLGTESSLGSLAPEVFTFENQVPTLLDEELNLLRGRDDAATSVGVPPFYNRLLWNFTSGAGEVAYVKTYVITDQPSDQNGDGTIDANERFGDGVIDEFDARVLFPQAHGDAWGHYLTAIKSYYRLLRRPDFTWLPRAEDVIVAGVPVQVDFLDERKFARAAAARARAGADVVNLTYRKHYVEAPAGQWQGYKDVDPARAWGVDEWARRAGQGAYFDWLVGNAMLPVGPGVCDLARTSCETDGDCPDPQTDRCRPPPAQPEGLNDIRRATVGELAEVATNFNSIQNQVDQSDAGLNPLGLAKGVVPFDIDPALVAEGMTHFEQIYERALRALTNTLPVFNHANMLTQSLRHNQDSANDFAISEREQERDYKYRLIELFGYPYSDDIGPQGTYPTGYNGPDLFHYMYVDESDLTGESTRPHSQIKESSVELGDSVLDTILSTVGIDLVQTDGLGEIAYSLALDGSGLVKPPDWGGARRAPGELQLELSEIYQNRARFQQAIVEYENLIEKIKDETSLLDATFAIHATEVFVRLRHLSLQATLSEVIFAAEAIKERLEQSAAKTNQATDATVSALPTSIGLSTDPSGPIRQAVKLVGLGKWIIEKSLATIQDRIAERAKLAKETATLLMDIELEVASNFLEAKARVKQIEQLVRAEAVARLELFTMEEIVHQSERKYLMKLAEGERLLTEMVVFRKTSTADMQLHRYRDMAFRIFRNDAIRKYRAQFELAARYAYLAATAYDYETNLLGTSGNAGRQFLNSIVAQRSLGQIVRPYSEVPWDELGEPVAGSNGIADPLARMKQNFDVLRGQLGFNNPQTETNRFSLRSEMLRIGSSDDTTWREQLARFVVGDLGNVPPDHPCNCAGDFRRYARPFTSDDDGPQPGLIIPFTTTVTFGQNFFGWPLGVGDSSYDPSNFSTRVRSVGVWFSDYDRAQLSATPRVYLIPAGMDRLRSPDAANFETRDWRVIDQKLPVPYPVTDTDVLDPGWIPLHDSLPEDLAGVRRFSSFRAYPDNGQFDATEMTTDTRLIGRSVWNTKWLLVIPAGSLFFDADADPLSDPPTHEGLERFIHGALVGDERDGLGVSDIKLFFQTYAYSGN